MEAQLILQTVLSKIETPQVHSAHSGRATTYPSEGLPAPRLGFPGSPSAERAVRPSLVLGVRSRAAPQRPEAPGGGEGGGQHLTSITSPCSLRTKETTPLGPTVFPLFFASFWVTIVSGQPVADKRPGSPRRVLRYLGGAWRGEGSTLPSRRMSTPQRSLLRTRVPAETRASVTLTPLQACALCSGH